MWPAGRRERLQTFVREHVQRRAAEHLGARGPQIEVVHLGNIITGTGAFELRDGPGDGSTIHWWEEVDPPLGAFGEWGASTFVAPIIRRIFTRSLTNLAGRAEREALRRSAA